MSNTRIFKFFTLSILSLIYFCQQSICQTPFISQSANYNKELIAELYKNKNGFGISKEESETIIKQGASPIYGEITYESMQTLIEDLNLNKTDVFYDLGSGIGKAVVQVYLNTPVQKSIGIELSPTRINLAEEVKLLMKNNNLLQYNRSLEFRQENIAQALFSDATVVYLCSTCFSEDLMKTITENLAKGVKNLRVLTLKKLPLHKNFELFREYKLSMTWTNRSKVYLYTYKA